jgi:NAD(P)-dependent dehydrogenase (short-subunit alcohol dehydrogenase family)
MYRVRVHAVARGFIETDMLNPISEKVKQRI